MDKLTRGVAVSLIYGRGDGNASLNIKSPYRRGLRRRTSLGSKRPWQVALALTQTPRPFSGTDRISPHSTKPYRLAQARGIAPIVFGKRWRSMSSTEPQTHRCSSRLHTALVVDIAGEWTEVRPAGHSSGTTTRISISFEANTAKARLAAMH